MMVYAHGRLDEKAATLTQLGTAVAGALPSTVAVTATDNDQSHPDHGLTSGSGGI
jgi:LmbE family N-acetylglucosaminyl deacetylase